MSYARARALHSLTFRLNLWYAAVLVAAFALAILGARFAAMYAIDREHHLLVASEVEQHRARIEREGLSGIDRFVAAERERSSLRWFVRVTDDEGHALLYDAPRADLQFDASELAPRREAHTIVSRGAEPGRPWRVLSTRVRGRLWLQLGVDDLPRRALIASVERSLSIWLACSLLLGVAGGVWFTRRALAPVRELTETCERIVAAADMTLRVPVREPRDELGRLSASFNRVLDRNQRLVEAMRQALDNVAHDLRTPLSRLRGGAELALSRQDCASLREALADCVEESEQALRMLHTLMDISEAESGVMRLHLEPVRLSQLARDAIDLYQHVADQREIQLTYASADERPIRGDRLRLGRAVANLVDNALKYSDPGGEVRISVEPLGPRTRLTVQDIGIGIEPAHLEQIWQRLYRADASRSRQGLGLGLSFVKAIVEAHGGTVAVASTPEHGSSFSIELPVLGTSEARAPEAAAET